jgi:hypothetical protein
MMMTMSGIGLIDTELAERIDQAAETGRRRALSACCSLAVDRTSLVAGRIDSARAALDAGWPASTGCAKLTSRSTISPR